MTDMLIREEQDAQPVRARPKRSGWRTVMFITLLVSLGLVVSGVLPLQQYLERENQVNAALDDLEVLEAENSAIASDVDALLSDQEIERVAREQYGFVRPGEVGYVVIVPEVDASSTPSQPAVPVEAEDPPGFFERVWRFLSGGDVVEDG